MKSNLVTALVSALVALLTVYATRPGPRGGGGMGVSASPAEMHGEGLEWVSRAVNHDLFVRSEPCEFRDVIRCPEAALPAAVAELNSAGIVELDAVRFRTLTGGRTRPGPPGKAYLVRAVAYSGRDSLDHLPPECAGETVLLQQRIDTTTPLLKWPLIVITDRPVRAVYVRLVRSV